jgi:MFS family permease
MFFVIFGAAVIGIGVAVVYPVSLSIAARRSERPERDVATMSFICFASLTASPAAVGALGEMYGLRVTFGLFACISLLALFLLPIVGARSDK